MIVYQEQLEQLIELRNTLNKKFSNYPYECCLFTALEVEKIGFEVKNGLFVDRNNIGHNHHWNEKYGVIYDLCASQFEKDFPIIYILDKKTNEAIERYVEGVCFML
jgi:hypothetical protein